MMKVLMRTRARWERGVLTAAAALLLGGAAPLAAQDVGLALGATPEAVQIEDLDGNAVNLSEYVGRKPVLVQFWATWCPLCEALDPKLRAAKQRHGDALEILVVAVGVNQNPRTIRRYMDRHPLPGRVLFDGRGRATRAFMAPSTSYVVALNAAGRVVYTGVGADQDIAAAAARAVAR
jgi:thiol-disulfide isomerase/thioredoxin